MPSSRTRTPHEIRGAGGVCASSCGSYDPPSVVPDGTLVPFYTSLDYTTNNSNYHESAPLKACPTPIGRVFHEDGRTRLLPCNSWKCPYCSRIKRRKFQERVEQGIGEIPRNARFLTLTQADRDPTYIMDAWNRLRANLRKKGITFNYVWVKELTQRGNVHLHCLIDKYIPQRLLSEAWKRATGGISYIVDIRAVRSSSNAVKYLCKYITKSFDQIGNYMFVRRERRYGFSSWSGWNIPHVKEPGWTADFKDMFFWHPDLDAKALIRDQILNNRNNAIVCMYIDCINSLKHNYSNLKYRQLRKLFITLCEL